MRYISLLTTFVVGVFWMSAGCATETESHTAERKEPIMVLIKTSKGDIKVELFEDKTPITVKNFLHYVDSGYYVGTIFHRVIDGFMIQGGGMTPDLQPKPAGQPIKNEADNGLKNERGTLAMARTREVDSATSQFFINVADNAFLDHKNKTPEGYGYCVFGQVVEGMDVVDKIKSVETTRMGPYADVPAEPVEILEVKRVETE
jgi:cyclophilin family peptidyl-prolyl cis-trans isomerase